tara:strand:+ start:130 stop:432 length:303 start_codon:yes stop_codon:yes gene_type:complete
MIIYKFEHEGNIYIGSTKNYKVRCFAHNQHKKQSRHNKTKLYKYCIEHEIFDIRPYCTIIEEIDGIYDKILLRNLEQDYLDRIKPNLNMVRAIGRKKNKI